MTVIHIRIIKAEETDEYVIYSFGDPPKRILGNVKICKLDGNIELLDTAEEKHKFLFQFVKTKLKEHHDIGEYPENTYFAS